MKKEISITEIVAVSLCLIYVVMSLSFFLDKTLFDAILYVRDTLLSPFIVGMLLGYLLTRRLQ